MWLLTAVGAVHGQNHFTFVLEQNKTYTIGREKGCEIRFESRSVRMKEGVLEVGDWDPTNHKKHPVLTFKVEPKKNGAFPTYKMMTPYENAVGSLNKEEYVCDELEHQGLYFENPGQGVELGAETWFFAQWIDLLILYDKLKDEAEDIRETMRRYCVAWQADFDDNDHPSLVLSQTYKSTQPCNYAVCYGIRILTPVYLSALLAKAEASWKKVADSQDSFSMPDELAPEYAPVLDTKLPNTRNDVGLWLPDPTRKMLFKGWKVLGLRSKVQPAEKRWITSMGAEWSDIDILSTPLLSSKDFMDRISTWVQEVEQMGSKDRAVIAHFAGVKEGCGKAGVDWNRVVATTCQSLGIWLSSGNICWASVKIGSVRGYLDDASGGVRPATYIGTAEPTALSTTSRRSPEKARPARFEAAPEPVLPDPSPQMPKVPSTYPDESAMEAGPSARTRAAEKAPSPEVELPAPTATASRRPLKRRAGKQTVSDLFDMDVEPSPSTDATPPDSLEPIKEDSLPLPTAGQDAIGSQSVMPPPTQSSSRLKRRAGQATQASTFDLFVESEQPSIKNEETSPEIRELYEATKRGDHPTLKRNRVVSAESARGTTDEDSLSSDIMPAELPTRRTRLREVEIADGAEGDVDMAEGGDEEDFVQKTLKRVAANRKAGRTQTTQATQNDTRAMPPPSLPMTHRRARSPSEETEVVESVKRPRLASPEKTTKPTSKAKSGKKGKDTTENTDQTNEPTTDPAFLLAVAKSRSKKAIDEMDKEFNNLKIPKSAIRGKGQSQAQSLNQVDMDNLPPDYGILNDFADEMRGNFIQVIRKDLYRKDGGARVVERADDGRPNFKKFKKKEIIRRDPVPLVLVSRNTEDAEMGEPYWPDPTGRSGNRMTQRSQTLTGENEDSLPLLPRARQRRLLTQQEDDDNPAPLSLSSTNRRRGVNGGDSQSATQQALPRTAQRKTRAASVISEADSVASSSTRGTRSTTTTAAKGGTSRNKKQPILLEDSEEEEGVKFTPSNSGLGRTGTRLGSTNGTNTTLSRKRGTQDVPPPTATASASASASAASRAVRSGQASSSVTVGRRKLLSIDDDDEGELVFKAAAKKRRLG